MLYSESQSSASSTSVLLQVRILRRLFTRNNIGRESIVGVIANLFPLAVEVLSKALLVIVLLWHIVSGFDIVASVVLLSKTTSPTTSAPTLHSNQFFEDPLDPTSSWNLCPSSFPCFVSLTQGTVFVFPEFGTYPPSFFVSLFCVRWISKHFVLTIRGGPANSRSRTSRIVS